MPKLADFLLARIAEDEEVLADWCEAMQQIVYELDSLAFDPSMTGMSRAVFWRALRHLALPYAAHPDYREDWRP